MACFEKLSFYRVALPDGKWALIRPKVEKAMVLTL